MQCALPHRSLYGRITRIAAQVKGNLSAAKKFHAERAREVDSAAGLCYTIQAKKKKGFAGLTSRSG